MSINRPVQMWESFESRTTDNTPQGDTVERVWFITGFDNDLEVCAHVEAHTPPFYDSLPRQDYKVEPIALQLWKVAVNYSDGQREREQEPEANDSRFELDIGGAPVRVAVSKANTRYPTSTAPDRKGTIAVDKDGQPQGVDVNTPTAAYAETHYLPRALITRNYANAIAGLAWHTNNAPFRIWAAGEVLFAGARLSSTTKTLAEVIFRFEISSNATGLTVGAITGISKQGHDYLDIAYEDTEVTADGKKYLLAIPKFVYIHRLYDSADFSLLGIGTT